MKQPPEQYRPKGGKKVIKMSKGFKHMLALMPREQRLLAQKEFVNADVTYVDNTDARLKLAVILGSGDKNDKKPEAKK